jgi:cell division protein FtsI (penicillin-binding protein 3)
MTDLAHPDLEAAEEAPPPPRPGRLRRAWGFAKSLFQLRVDKSRARVALVAFAFLALFGVIAGRLALIALSPDDRSALRRATGNAIAAARPDIVDRNGEVMATDVHVVSVFADPRKVVDKDEAVELLTAVLPDLNARELRDKLGSRKGFVWVKREITPRQQAEVHRLGIPGLGFLPEHKRIYPNGSAGAQVLGFTNLDNVGIAGIEKYIDAQGLQDLNGAGFALRSEDLKPVQLSLDLRVQHALRDEIAKGMAKYKAKAAAGAIMDVTTSEVIALVSLPDYDPNNPVDALDKDRINRINVGVFEMGSTFKALTTAMALDSGKFTINSSLDARSNLRYGKFSIGDYHAQHRVMTVPEVFIYSSNIGTAKMALGLGVEAHKAFLRKAGQLERLVTELPENALPIVPSRWGELNTITIAFGHGIAVAPLQALMAVGALVNGGVMIKPTFLKRGEEEARKLGQRIIKPETSEAMRYVMRLNATKGSASAAAVAGFFVGGKTGTAEKVVHGRYSKTKNLNTFTAVYPMDKPKYVFLTIIDEPQAVEGTHGFMTSGWNAAPITGNVIERVAPMLSVPPRFEPPQQAFPLMVKLGAWGTR